MKKEYEKWFVDKIIEKYKLFGGSIFGPLDTYMKKHGFFCTMMFSHKQISNARLRNGLGSDSYDVEHDTFLAAYRYISEGLYGKNWQRSVFSQKAPFVISCIDFSGSKYANSATLSRHNAHIHAVWMIHPDDVVRFNQIIGGPRFKLTFRKGIPADRIRFDAFDPLKGGTSAMATYAAKSLIKSTAAGLSSELLRFYPDSKHGHRDAYKRRHDYLKENLGLERLRANARKGLKAIRKEMEPWERMA